MVEEAIAHQEVAAKRILHAMAASLDEYDGKKAGRRKLELSWKKKITKLEKQLEEMKEELGAESTDN